MLNFPGPEKILMLAILALVVLGPSRLPQAARTAGKWIGELRKLTTRFQEEMSGALAEPKDALTAAVGDLRNEVGGWRNEISGFSRSLTTLPNSDATPPNGDAVPGRDPAPWITNTTGAMGATTDSGATDGATTDGAIANGAGPSGSSTDFVSSGLSRPGLPSLPPVPDDPSLN